MEMRARFALALVSFNAAAALDCYVNLDLEAWSLLNWTEQANSFFASDYPTLNTPRVTEGLNGSDFSCMTGQAFPRGFQLLGTCLFNQVPKTLDERQLAFFNLQGAYCDTDLCNDDCNKSGSWWDGRQINIGIILILVALGITGIAYLLCFVAKATDKGGTAGAAVSVVVEGPSTMAPTTTDAEANAGDATSSTKEPEKKPKEPEATVRQVLSVASNGELLVYGLGVFCAIATGMGIPLMSLLFGRNLDSLSSPDDSAYGSVVDLVLQLVYIGLGSMVSSALMYSLLENIGARIAQRWRERYLAAVLRQDIGWFDLGNQSGGLLSSMTVDTRAVEKGIGIQAGYWDVALVCLAGVPIMAVASGIMLSTNEKTSKLESAAYAKAGAIAGEAIASMRTVQALNAQPGILARFTASLVPAERAALIKTVANGCSLGLLNGAFMLIYLFATLYVGRKLIDEYDDTNCHLHGLGDIVKAFEGAPLDLEFPQCKTDIGDILGTLFCVVFGGMASGQTADPLAKMSAAKAAVHKILLTVTRVPVIDTSSDAGTKPEGLQGKVELADVKFSYPARPNQLVATGLSLSIAPGQTVALVGRSGSGKSTVMALVQRFYDPASGTVSLDGHDLRSINVRHLRSKIGLVGQEPVLFSGSLKQNITYGSPGQAASDEQVVDASKLANAHEFIKALDKGYDTDVGAGGSKISGGQKQRVAIARAIIRNPVLLLLDEATSALDNESEKIVQQALTELLEKQKRTTIVIAHRLSTIRNADKIVVLDAGALAEQGTHDELVDRRGIYKELLDQQGGADRRKSSLVEKSEPSMLGLGKSAPGPSDDSMNNDQPSAQEGALDRKAQAKAEAEAQKVTAKKANENKSRIWKMQQQDRLYVISGAIGAIANGLVFPVMAVSFAGMLFTFFSSSPDYIRTQSVTIAASFGSIAALLCVPAALAQFYGFGVAGERLTTRIRIGVFEKMLRTDLGYFDLPENGTGTLVASISTAAANVKALTGEALGRNVNMLACLIFGPFLAIYFSWHMVLAVFAIMPFLGAGNMVFLAIMNGQFGPDSSDDQRALNIMSEALTSVRTVASLQLEGRLSDMFRAAGQAATTANVVLKIKYGCVFAFGLTMQFLSWGAIFWFAALMRDKDEINFREMIYGLFVAIFSTFGLANATQNMTDANLAAQAVVSTFDFLDKKLIIDGMDTQGGSKPEGLQGKIECKDIVFAYPSRPHIKVAKGFNLSVEAGSTVALVGKSGCGKSTTVLLLERFYDPASGTVLLDGHDLRSINVRHLRSKIGLVGQEPVLFSGTIAFNIARGMHGSEATREQVETAAQSANAHRFISSLANGYDTDVGDKGGQLSGGQKQRVAIARAIICNPVLLLLDEATSALDNESEKIVQQALTELLEKQKRTTIVIAHRLSTIRNADKICYIRNGKVAEEGTHDELMDKEGHYAAMVQVLEA